MEKTFREVIADIKDGEVWECTREDARVKEIKMHEEGNTNLIVFNFGKMTRDVRASIQGGDRFILKRKEYTFEEAFKAYEEGKEIESVISNTKFKKQESTDGNIVDFHWVEGDKVWWNFAGFDLELIRGKWYIND